MTENYGWSTANYFATCPISEPATGFNRDADMGGFAWDNVQGLHIPMQGGELEPFTAPAADPTATVINTTYPA
jgi:hypothetical protein